MNFIRLVIQQPVTVIVGVILILIAGLIALDRIPIQLTPNVEDTVISVNTFWEGASPEEIEREIVDRQEEKLQGLTNLRAMTSSSQQNSGAVRLEFTVGTDKEAALREVSDKLREVPEYPDGVDEPIVQASDPENRDYIAWIIFATTDPEFDIRTLRDFASDRIEPVLERVEGISEINVLGGRERETQIRFDPVRLAQLNITPGDLVSAIQRTNRNVSAGQVPDGKREVRLRTVGQYETPEDVENTVIAYREGGPIYVRDVAEVVETYKEAGGFVRSKGRRVIAINAQKEPGTNIMAVMDGARAAIEELNRPGGVLKTEAKRLGLNGTLELYMAYDQTVYIDDALALVQNNIWLGGGIAVLVLLLFLRSIRSVGIIALAIPISVIGAVVAMVAMGRSVNVISLAGMAFAVGMVVDNAIVVLENIFRHLEMGKKPMHAAYDGAREVWGAVLASTLTTIVVFIPILLIEEEAGQLFRDIALAICAAVALSLIVSISVIPTAAARILRPRKEKKEQALDIDPDELRTWRNLPARMLRGARITLTRPSHGLGLLIYKLSGSWTARFAIIIALTAVAVAGTIFLKPPADYLPAGNRNLVFGMMIPPPGYTLEKMEELGDRVQTWIEPFWKVQDLEPGTPEYERALANLPEVPTFDWMAQAPGPPITPPPIDNYFFVQFSDILFHGAVAADEKRVVDVATLLNHSARSEILPDVRGFAFQVPLFRLGGSSGSAVKINLAGDDLQSIIGAAGSLHTDMMQKYSARAVQANPGNYNIPRTELRVFPDRRALADVGMTPLDLALAVQTHGDGAIIGEYRVAGDNIDLKLIAESAVDARTIGSLDDIPVAAPIGKIVTLGSLAQFERVPSQPQINHSGRRRSVTLEFTPPQGLALEQAIADVEEMIAAKREAGGVSDDVIVTYTGSASKLQAVQNAMLGDGTFIGTLNSSLVLALIVVYLLMCVLFQSFLKPLVIMFSVPLATLGGFLALFAVFIWSVTDRYMPMQMLDVLTMLGFIILIGVVVNNAILIVHQTMNFMKEGWDGGWDGSPSRRGVGGSPSRPHGSESRPTHRRAIAEAVRTRVRPIFMGTLTSVGGMLPLVLMPGSGSELYRGLGSVVVGGLLVSTIFTLLLVPLLLSVVLDIEAFFRREETTRPAARTAAEPPRRPEGRGVPGGAAAEAMRR